MTHPFVIMLIGFCLLIIGIIGIVKGERSYNTFHVFLSTVFGVCLGTGLIMLALGFLLDNALSILFGGM